MRNLKKVLALVIAFSMMLSVVAFASYNDVAADAEYAGAVELLSALEIIKGDDLGNFNPDNTITRAEMAAIVCRAKGLESAANGAKGFTAFNDVAADHWASGYVNLASQNGIINGYGDGNFGPEDTVTYEQAVKMLVCAIGFEPMAATKGGFPTGYLVVANGYGITEGVTASVEAPRKTVAQLVYNTLDTPMMDLTAFGADAEYEIFDGKGGRDYKTLLTEMDIYVATGVVMDKDVDEVNFVITDDSEGNDYAEFTTLDAEQTFEINGSDIMNYQFQNVDAYVQKNSRNDYKVVAVVASGLGETFEIVSDDIKDVKALEVEYYTDAANSSKTKVIKLASEKDEVAYTVVNNKEKENVKTSLEAVLEDKDVVKSDIEVIFIENTGDSKYDVVVCNQYYSQLVTEVEADNDRIEINGDKIELDFDDEDKDIILVDDAGNELTLADFAEDDVVAVLSDSADYTMPQDFDDYIKIIKLSNAAVTGTVDESYTSNGDDYVVIDGAEYMVDSENCEELAVGDEGIFYVGMTGKVIYFDGSSVGQNYGYIIEAAMSDASFTDDEWEVKLLTKEDGVVTYGVTDDMNDKFTLYFTGAVKDKEYDYSANKEAFEFEKDVTDEVLWSKQSDTAKLSEARLITYKTNSKGEIRAFDMAEGSQTEAKKSEYKASTNKVAGAILEDDAVVFVISEDDADDVYASDISYLVDETEYTGYAFKDTDKEYSVMVVIEGDGQFSEEVGFAIATKVSKSEDAEGNEIYKVNYVRDEEEGTITFDEDSDPAKDSVAYDDETSGLEVGDVFLFNANAEGEVSKYAILAQYDESTNKLVLDADAIAEVDSDDFDDGVTFGYGYIESQDKKSGKNYLTIVDDRGAKDVKTEPTVVDANEYTYYVAGRNAAVKTGSFMAEDVREKYTNAKGEELVYYVFIRYVDGDVADIYSISYGHDIATPAPDPEPEA